LTEFELLAIPLSLVLGLGIAQILGEVVATIRNRQNAGIHWLPLAWAAWIFLVHVQFFFYLWDLYELEVIWTWSQFGPTLWHVTLLFIAAGLILPGPRERARNESLIDDFQLHGRLALLPFALVTIDSILLNVFQYGDVWFGQANVFNMIFAALTLAAFFTQGKLRAASTLAVGAVLLYGLTFVWSAPGVPPGG
jgi:hypothetical protein